MKNIARILIAAVIFIAAIFTKTATPQPASSETLTARPGATANSTPSATPAQATRTLIPWDMSLDSGHTREITLCWRQSRGIIICEVIP